MAKKQKIVKEVDSWMLEVEKILSEKNIQGLTENQELRKAWVTLYNQKYSPIQAFNYIILGIID